MTILDTELEAILLSILQKDLKFTLNNKQFRKGKLLLFKQNNYCIELTIRKNDDIKRFEIPIPFNIEEWKSDGLVYFDYRLKTLSDNDSNLLKKLKSLKVEGDNRFYDNILEIEVMAEAL